MTQEKLIKINYKEFSKTRNTIQLYAQLLSAIKGKLVPHQKNWEEFSLTINAKGFTTGPMPVGIESETEALELILNLIEHKLEIFFGKSKDEIDLHQKNIDTFTKLFLEKVSEFKKLDFQPEEKFWSQSELVYDNDQVKKLWNLFRQVYFAFLEFRGSTLFETSNINFWAHHFDMALLVFSGKLIDGQEPENWDYSREQMNFGLSSGDDEIGEPYFYVTAYPFDKKLYDCELPDFAQWQRKGWQGVIVKFSKLPEPLYVKKNIIDLFSNLLECNLRSNKKSY
jgi:hypothetical protein